MGTTNYKVVFNKQDEKLATALRHRVIQGLDMTKQCAHFEKRMCIFTSNFNFLKGIFMALYYKTIRYHFIGDN